MVVAIFAYIEHLFSKIKPQKVRHLFDFPSCLLSFGFLTTFWVRCSLWLWMEWRPEQR